MTGGRAGPTMSAAVSRPARPRSRCKSSRSRSSDPTDVLVEVAHCGICGTDLHLVLERYARPDTRARPRVGGHDRRGRHATSTAGRSAHASCRTRRRVAASAARAGAAVRRCACAATPPDLLDFTRGAFCRYKVVAGAAAAPRPRRAVDPRPPRSPSRPRSRSTRSTSSGATPDDRVLVTGGGPVGLLTTAVLRARGDRRHHGVGAGAAPARARRWRSARARVVEPDELPRAPMGRPVARAVHDRVRVLGQRGRRGVGARPARLRGHARVRRHRARACRASTTTARSSSSSRSSARTTTTPRASRPRSSCSRRARCRSTR